MKTRIRGRENCKRDCQIRSREVSLYLSESSSVAFFQNPLFLRTYRGHVDLFDKAMTPLGKRPAVFVSSELATSPKLIVLRFPLSLLHPPINQLLEPGIPFSLWTHVIQQLNNLFGLFCFFCSSLEYRSFSQVPSDERACCRPCPVSRSYND